MVLKGIKILMALIGFSVFAQMDCGSKDGFQLPCWETYLRHNESEESLPFYPYAKRPNGCSFLNQRPGESDEIIVGNDTYSFKSACNFHDSCYYSLKSDEHSCNKKFLSKMHQACLDSGSDETRFWCFARAKMFFEAVEKSSPVVFRYSQAIQWHYLHRVEKYIDARRR